MRNLDRTEVAQRWTRAANLSAKGSVLTIQTPGMPQPMQVVPRPDFSDLRDPRERELLRLWRAARMTDGALPAPEDLRGFLFVSLAPHLLRLEPARENDFTVLFYGDALAAAYGRDLTGRHIADFPGPETSALLTIFRFARRHRQPVATLTRARAGRSHSHWSRLILPMRAGAEESQLLVLQLPANITSVANGGEPQGRVRVA